MNKIAFLGPVTGIENGAQVQPKIYGSIPIKVNEEVTLDSGFRSFIVEHSINALYALTTASSLFLPTIVLGL